jgi:Protein of unknown function (DUF998)
VTAGHGRPRDHPVEGDATGLVVRRGSLDFIGGPGMGTPATKWTGWFLIAGIAAGPLFIGAVLIQSFARSGYDITRVPLSLLSLGDLGWIQKTNFIVTGLLVIACSAGMRRLLHPGRGGTWGALLIGIYGVGFIAAGVFAPDPSMGFPPGTPQGVSSAAQSWHAQLHGAAFDVSFLALIVACFVFARRFAAIRRGGWAAYCAATGVAAPILIVLAIVNLSTVGGLLFLVTGAVADAWLSLVAWRLLTER